MITLLVFALPAARTNAAAHNTAEPQARMELELSFTAGAERLELAGNLIRSFHATEGHVNGPAPSKLFFFISSI